MEKEALAVFWACERFHDYILGSKVEIEMDHKPLAPLFSYRIFDGPPPHVLRFHLRFDRYHYQIQFVTGKLLYAADTLSHAPVSELVDSIELEEEVESLIAETTKQAILHAWQKSLDGYCQKQAVDPSFSKVMEYIKL